MMKRQGSVGKYNILRPTTPFGSGEYRSVGRGRDAMERIDERGLPRGVGDGYVENVAEDRHRSGDSGSMRAIEVAPQERRRPNSRLEEEMGSRKSGTFADGRAQPTGAYREWLALKILLLSPINVLLIFLPLGLAAKFLEWNSAVMFFYNFMAIIPLAHLLGGATEALAQHTGQLIGGLLNATFGNAVEMIMCIQAVRAGLIRVVQGNLVGSILSNLLLVLGMSIAASGSVRHSQSFNAKGANANMSCLLVAAISVALPTVFELFSFPSKFEVIEVSRVCSVFLIGAYCLFLTFMMRTHRDVFEDDNAGFADDEIALSLFNAMVMLTISTVLICLCSAALVSSIQDVSAYLPEAFIGVILLPIVGNASEHALAVHFAFKGMMDLALGVAVGSSICIALLVVPVSILYGWAVDQPMNLAFRDFDTLCMLLSVFLVSQVLQHGQTNWLHGAMLIVVYLFIATQTCYIRDKA